MAGRPLRRAELAELARDYLTAKLGHLSDGSIMPKEEEEEAIESFVRTGKWSDLDWYIEEYNDRNEEQAAHYREME